MPALNTILNFGVPIVLILIGILAGRRNERRHLRSLATREDALRGFPVLNVKQLPEQLTGQIEWAHLCTGEVVIASDYFKSFASHLKGLIGGRIRTFETLLHRGRRESALRVREQALSAGADLVLNLRFETATVGRGGRRGLPMAEVVAYGTAVKLRRETQP